ncbi:MAG: tetratricopeptide repeat protein [Rikenellaceae bacterium]|nr:tetratricopeptide repeat protein [Rikenellaceae bacterium]MBQ3260594.1 tetratricopeptide repeat protein [Alistipes sp.]MBQ7342833.1 tetratricopeptide repeat protein [Alistipes sp.]
MKKLFLLAVAMMTVCAVSAQNELIAKFNEGVAAMNNKDFAAAITAYEAFIDKGADSDDTAVLANVAQAKKYAVQCYMVLGGRNAKMQNFEKAEEVLSEGVMKAELYGETQLLAKMKSRLADIYFAHGATAYNSKDYATAVKVFSKGYEANPRNTNLALNLAMSYCELGQFETGMEIYRNVAAMNPERHAEAVAKAKEMITFYTTNQVAKLQAEGNNDGVIAMAEKMLAEDPASALAEKIRLQAYNGKKEYDKVIELGETAAMAQTSDEDKSDVYFLIGAAYNAKYNAGGNKDEALKNKVVEYMGKVTAGNAVEGAKAAIADLTK